MGIEVLIDKYWTVVLGLDQKVRVLRLSREKVSLEFVATSRCFYTQFQVKPLTPQECCFSGVGYHIGTSFK